jgi:hypothetical protein
LGINPIHLLERAGASVQNEGRSAVRGFALIFYPQNADFTGLFAQQYETGDRRL